MTGWIDLSEFATKYGVSTSTLRRRIRTKTIEYKLEKGKYLLLDSKEVMSSAPLFSRVHTLTEGQIPRQTVRSATSHAPNLQEVLERLERENKQLKEQVAELETLVRALEGETSQTV